MRTATRTTVMTVRVPTTPWLGASSAIALRPTTAGMAWLQAGGWVWRPAAHTRGAAWQRAAPGQRPEPSGGGVGDPRGPLAQLGAVEGGHQVHRLGHGLDAERGEDPEEPGGRLAADAQHDPADRHEAGERRRGVEQVDRGADPAARALLGHRSQGEHPGEDPERQGERDAVERPLPSLLGAQPRVEHGRAGQAEHVEAQPADVEDAHLGHLDADEQRDRRRQVRREPAAEGGGEDGPRLPGPPLGVERRPRAHREPREVAQDLGERADEPGSRQRSARGEP